MAFPTVASSASGNSGANSVTHNITLPAGVSSGDLLIVFFSNDDAATASVTTPASGWNGPIGQGVSPSNSNRLSIFYRWADGSEGATITITLTSTNGAAWTVYRITGAHSSSAPELSTVASGTSTSPDPSSLSPSWGAEDTTWFAVYAWDGNVANSAYPTNYSSNQLTDRWANIAGTGIASSSREVNASSEDPGAGTIGSEQWVAYTVAIRPAPAGVFEVDADNAFAFTEDVDDYTLTFLVDADNEFAFTETAEHNFIYVDADDPLGLTDAAEIAAYVVLAADRVFFDTPYGEGGQDVQHNYIDIECSNEFAFQSLGGLNWLIDVRQYLGFTERYLAGEIGDNLGLTDSVRQAYAVTADDSFNWINHDDEDGPEYALVRAYKAVNEFAFTETVSFGEYQDVYQFLEFEDEITAENTEFERPLASGFVRQSVAFRITGVNCPEKEYTPFVGDDSGSNDYPEVSVTPPTLGSGVFTLTFPRVSPSLTLVLKNPAFGNTDAVTFNRIDRVTRGGERKIFSDTDWGSWQTLELTIENICGTTIDEILTFLNTSLGKEIGLLDWENRNWRGFISAPDSDVTPQVNGFRLRIIFEGELV